MLEVGEIALGRFIVEREVAAGGMGVIYRARDLESGGLVALKGLRLGTEDAARFEREAQALAMLEHPAIVRYVAHGGTELKHDLPVAFIAMQWLEGQDLAARLDQGTLDVPEAVTLASRMSEALGVVHAAGLVHRDVKPGNIFLVGGGVDGATLVDFGLARGPKSLKITADGTVLGTPAYMAPEQLRGGQPDPRIDVFALGAVLYEALSGEPPHGRGASAMVLTRILVDVPRPLADVRPEVPVPLSALVASMLAKDPDARPRDGAALAAALRDAAASVHTPSVVPALGEVEQILGVLLIARWASEEARAEASIRAVAAQYGAEVAGVVGSGAVLRCLGRATPEEQAVLGARAAMAIRMLPGVRAVSIGMIHPDEGGIGGAVERTAPPSETTSAGVRLDAVIAGLLPSRFLTERHDDDVSLVGEVDALDLPREVLGRPTPFVLRERERDLLARSTTAAFEGRRSDAFVVVGEAGSGKSRIRQEALRVLGGSQANVTVVSARGDVAHRGAPLSMISRAVARAACLTGDAGDRARLAARVERHVAAADRAEVQTALAHMVGLDAGRGDEDASRLDRAVLGARIRDAFVAFIRAEATAMPVLFVLEDLHEGDAASIWLITEAVGSLPALPIVVWAFGRPEAEQRFGHRLAPLSPKRIELPPLDPLEADRFARACLAEGSDLDVATLCTNAPANPLVVEEIVRATHGRPSAELGVIARSTAAMLVEARLDELEPPLRRTLRAGAVFGGVFWRSAVEALVGPLHRDEVEHAFRELCRRGWLVESTASRFTAEEEIAFSYDAYRAAAERLLAPAERSAAHAAALHWLEIRGEPDPGVLAYHAKEAGLTDRAAHLLAEATERAIVASDVTAAETLVTQGLALAPSGELAGRLHALAAEVHRWRGDSEAAMVEARAAMGALDGSERWFEAAGELATAASRLRHLDVLVDVSSALERALRPNPTASQVIATARAAMFLEHAGAAQRSGPLYAWLDTVAPRFERVPIVAARVAFARAWRGHASGDWSVYRDQLRVAMHAFERAADKKACAQMQANLGHALLELGEFAAAERESRAVLLAAIRIAAPPIVALAQNNLGMALGRQGRYEEALSWLGAAARAYAEMKDPRLEGATRTYLAEVALWAGKLSDAETEARRAVSLLERVPVLLPHGLAVLSQIERARGRVAESLVTAERAVEVLAGAGRSETSPISVHLALVEALLDAGETEAARERVALARTAFDQYAARISDLVTREAYRLIVPEHARLEELERRLAVPG